MTGQDGPSVILVEDDAPVRLATAQAMELAGFAVRAFAGAEGAMTAIAHDFDGVIVSDIRMPRIDGLQLLAAVQRIDAELPVVLVTGHGDVPMAVAALKQGAYDFLTKPFAADHLAATVRRAAERRALMIENRRLRAAAEASEAASPLIGSSPAMARLRATIARLAEADLDVLVEGESGTGKELVAIQLHRLGRRRARPFVAVPCAALTEETGEIELFGHAPDSMTHTRLGRVGQIAVAHGGTLLLDDVDALPAALQVKLLRVIEEREVRPIGAERADAVNIRIVATSAIDLAAAAARGRFRADLYHRLAVTRLRVPPLRERDADRLILYAAFAAEAGQRLGRSDTAPSEAVRRHLLAHCWPGNVRELRNYAFETVLAAQEDAETEAGDLRTRVGEFEAGAIAAALRQTGGNVVRALALLGIPRKTLYDKLARYGIDPAGFRGRSEG